MKLPVSGKLLTRLALMTLITVMLFGCNQSDPPGDNSDGDGTGDPNPQSNFSINSMAGIGGTISPATVTVNRNETAVFTVTASSGYIIDTVSGCGGTLAGNAYQTGPITAQCAVIASFRSDSTSPPPVGVGFEMTMPPATRPTLPAHPRLYLTNATLPALRIKLEHPIYAQDVEQIKNSTNPTDQAFHYLVWGDENAGQSAVNALLSNNITEWGRMENAISVFQAALMYDWLYQRMTSAERAQAAAIVKERAINIDHAVLIARDGIQYYWNDMWARGAAFSSIAALALEGDDSWATQYLDGAYYKPFEQFSPYAGGAVDVLNSLALDSGGGYQTGIFDIGGTGYEAMFMIGAGLFMTAWQSATGEALLTQTTYFEQLPYYFTYAFLKDSDIGEHAKQILEYITGIGSAESAALAKWLLDRYGRAQGATVMRLILGDLANTQSKSPEELQIAKAKYLSGADLVVSRTGWSDTDTTLFMFARHWDTARYEPDSGLVSIYKGSKPLLVRGIKGKKSFSVINNSGIWVWDQADEAGTLGQGNTYWQSLIDTSRRALSAAVVLEPNNTFYHPKTLTGFLAENGVVTASTQYEKLLRLPGVELAKRTVIHNTSINEIKVVDHLKVPIAANIAWGLRFAEEPVISGNTITTPDMTITLNSPASTIYWSGGIGSELIGPAGTWQGDGKDGFVEGYGADLARKNQYGLGYVFAKPLQSGTEYIFDATIQIH